MHGNSNWLLCLYTTRAIQTALWCHWLAVWNLVLISRNMRHCCCFCEHSCNNTHSNLAHLSFSYLHLPTQCCVALHTIGHLRLYLCALFKTALITPYFVITDIWSVDTIIVDISKTGYSPWHGNFISKFKHVEYRMLHCTTIINMWNTDYCWCSGAASTHVMRSRDQIVVLAM